MFIGLILIAVGVFALLVQLGVLSGSLWSYVWPSIIIAFGLSLLWGRRRWHRWFYRGEDKGEKH